MPQHPILPEEAREALELVERTVRQMRRAVAHGGMPYFLLIWGTVWVLGFGATHFLGPESPQARTVWWMLIVPGLIASALVGWRLNDRVRHAWFGASVGLFWLTWMVYASLIVFFAQPQTGIQTSLLIALFAMFGYVTSGLLYRSLFLSGLGALMTALILIGYLLIPAWFSLWMAILGGGSLIAAGLYMRYAWR